VEFPRAVFALHVKHATTDELQQRVRQAVRTSLGTWWQFFEGIDTAYGRG
jgi:pyrroloquinoline quinone (PQQ) biosynthesis protein C